MPFDLFLGVPVHRVPAVVAESGMCVDGWIPVDPVTLEPPAWPDVYAVGDVTSVGTPKAGVFAEGQAAVVADAIIARARGGDAPPATTGVACATSSSAATVSPSSTSPSLPVRRRSAPTAVRRVDRREDAFGTTRIKRWFGRDW